MPRFSQKSHNTIGPTPPTSYEPRSTLQQNATSAWLLGLLGLAVLLIPVLIDSRIQRVISIAANDQSLSGLAFPEVPQQHCEALVRQLKTGDRIISIVFADRPERIQDKKIRNTFTLLKECRELDPDHRRLSSSLGTQRGTSPERLLDQIIDTIAAKRTQGLQAPVVVTIWLQAAEPLPNQSPINFTRLQEQVEKVTSDRGIVAIISPPGQLQTDLMTYLKTNPKSRICTLNEVDECVAEVFEMARRSPNH